MLQQSIKTVATISVLALLSHASIAAETSDSWITLFDGSDLAAWDNGAGGPPRAGWVVADGTVTRKERAGYLWTKERFGDFLLELEFNTEGNSGVFVRTGNPQDCVQTGFEMQVDRPRSQLTKHSVGAFYDALAPSKQAATTGWNKVAIKCVGSKITIDMNGQRIIDVDVDDWNTAGRNPDGTKNKYRKALKDFPREGHIGLQEHGAVVSFRNIRVKRLN